MTFWPGLSWPLYFPEQGGVAVGDPGHLAAILQAEGGQAPLGPLRLVDGVRGEVAVALGVLALPEAPQFLLDNGHVAAPHRHTPAGGIRGRGPSLIELSWDERD